MSFRFTQLILVLAILNVKVMQISNAKISSTLTDKETLQLSTNRKSAIGFRLAYSHFFYIKVKHKFNRKANNRINLFKMLNCLEKC